MTYRSDPERKILEDAADLITGDRAEAYGPAELDFACVALMMRGWLSARYKDKYPLLDSEDVAAMMVFMKMRRQAHEPNRENLVDAIGYLALMERLTPRR